MVAASVGAPGDPRMDFKELIGRFNKNTAAYKEQTRKMERQIQELGLAPLIIQEREPTELERLLQRWELPSREPEGVELPSREPEGVELPSREPEGVELPSREPEGVEIPSREPRGEEPPHPEPSSMQASPALPREVPSPVIVDTWPEGPTHPQARPWKRAKIDICGLEGAPYTPGGNNNHKTARIQEKKVKMEGT
ncbi:UNVERIFIED_CONTAM: hypothetical protein FKN15_038575 [Acipenser sinensis]